jgi:hypothetical protein
LFELLFKPKHATVPTQRSFTCAAALGKQTNKTEVCLHPPLHLQNVNLGGTKEEAKGSQLAVAL